MGNSDDRETTWIGLVEVRPLAGNDALGSALGAFVNVLALCADRQSFVEKSSQCLEEYGFKAVRHQDVEPLSSWIATNVLHSELRDLEALISEENPVQFDEFQAFAEEG